MTPSLALPGHFFVEINTLEVDCTKNGTVNTPLEHQGFDPLGRSLSTGLPTASGDESLIPKKKPGGHSRDRQVE